MLPCHKWLQIGYCAGMEQLGVEGGFAIKIITLRRRCSYFRLAHVNYEKKNNVVYGYAL